jgi:uncharacterized protein YebE (UPF0316 family)
MRWVSHGHLSWHCYRATPGFRSSTRDDHNAAGVELAKALRAAGHRLAEVKGHARDGDLTILFVETPRRRSQQLVREATALDANCFCLVNDVRVARSGLPVATVRRPWLAQEG